MLLAAGAPLSLQAHPSKAQAVEGFRSEEAAGIDLHDPRRNYKDPNHKPELIVRDLDLDLIQTVRERWAFYRDRRPDAYDDLVTP